MQVRDLVKSIVPWWLPDVGYRVLYGIGVMVDLCVEWATQGIQARMPGKGTPTALPSIGEDRRIIRGIDDTDAQYGARLIEFRERWKRAGSIDAVARIVHEYLPGRPQVRVVTRFGKWCNVSTSGVVTLSTNVAELFDWDSMSHPEKRYAWSDMWIIVYPVGTFTAGNWGTGDGQLWGSNSLAFGMTAQVEHMRTLRTLIDEWKAAHSKVVAVIFASNLTQFDPDLIGSMMPDGWWGNYSKRVGGNSVAARPDVLRFLDNEGAA